VKDYHDDFVTLAHYWGDQGDWDKSVFYNVEALRQNDRSSQAWQNLGFAYTQRGQDEEDMDRAEECLFKALELNPTEAHAYGNLAYIYFMWDRPVIFDVCLKRALTLDPALAEPLSELRRFQGTKVNGWEERAHDHLATIEGKLATRPGDPRLTHELGRVLALRLEDYEAGLAVLHSIPEEALAADEGLSRRQQIILSRIERSQRYLHLLGRPLPTGAAGLNPRVR